MGEPESAQPDTLLAATIAVTLLAACWSALLLWRLRQRRAWVYSALPLFVAAIAMVGLQYPDLLQWLRTSPSGVAWTVLLIAVAGLLVVGAAERALAGLQQSQTASADGPSPRPNSEAHAAVAEPPRLAEDEYFHLVANSLPVCFAYVDAEQRFQFNNRVLADWFGLNPDEIKGRTVREVLGESAYAKIRHRIDTVLSGRQVSYEDTLSLGGQERNIFAIYVPHLGEQGQTLGYRVLVTDISARKALETSLLKSIERFRLVTDSLPVCIAYVDAEERFQFNNRVYADWFGLDSTQMQGRTVREVLGEDSYSKIRGRVEAALRGQEINYEDTLTLGGKERSVYATYVPHFGDDGQTLGYCALVTDVSEVKSTEEQQRRLETKLQHRQKLESLGILGGGIAHDFNNLLMSMLANAELALMKLPPDSTAKDELRDISTAGLRAAELTRQLLAYSGKGKFVTRPVDLSQLVEEMAHLVEVSIPMTVVLRYELAPDLPAIEADATQIRQIVMNLILNASDSIGKDPGLVTVKTALVEADEAYLAGSYLDEPLPARGYICFEVADTGCGMDEETKAKIFDPFFSTKPDGRGLGLAAVQGIVRGHKGALKVTSKPGEGTVFKVLFPCSAVVEASNSGPAASQEWRGSGTVLVVDDEEPVLKVSKKVLEKQGFDVLCAEDGKVGLDLYSRHADEIVAVVLDMKMPGLTGVETLREMRGIRSDVKALLSSGYDEQDLSQRFASKGFAGFLHKPYGPRELITALREIID